MPSLTDSGNSKYGKIACYFAEGKLEDFTMNRLLLSAAIFSAAAAFSPAANATQSIVLSPPAIDGSIAGSFHNDGLVSGAFSDVFNFVFPSSGVVGATISSIFSTGQNNNVSFSSVTFNGSEFGILSTGQIEFRALNNLVVPSGLQSLIVSGTSGGNSSYAGTLSFVPNTKTL